MFGSWLRGALSMELHRRTPRQPQASGDRRPGRRSCVPPVLAVLLMNRSGEVVDALSAVPLGLVLALAGIQAAIYLCRVTAWNVALRFRRCRPLRPQCPRRQWPCLHPEHRPARLHRRRDPGRDPQADRPRQRRRHRPAGDHRRPRNRGRGRVPGRDRDSADRCLRALLLWVPLGILAAIAIGVVVLKPLRAKLGHLSWVRSLAIFQLGCNPSASAFRSPPSSSSARFASGSPSERSASTRAWPRRRLVHHRLGRRGPADRLEPGRDRRPRRPVRLARDRRDHRRRRRARCIGCARRARLSGIRRAGLGGRSGPDAIAFPANGLIPPTILNWTVLGGGLADPCNPQSA